MTRTIEVAPTFSRTRHACARGKPPVGVQIATSRSFVRLDLRMPTRSISSSCEPARNPSAPETFLTSLESFPRSGTSSRGKASTFMRREPSADHIPSEACWPSRTNASSALLR